MANEWEQFIDNLKDGSGKLAKDELKALINNARQDSDAFIREQGKKMAEYVSQLAAGKITKPQFEGLIVDVKDLTEMKELELSVAAKASAQRIVAGISKLIIDGLLKCA